MLNSASVGNGKEVRDGGARVCRFGTFELEVRAGELRRNGLKVRLQEQPFQVLSLLLETPGQIVTREELRNRLWPADTFVDFDHSLNAAIKRLRDALGDSAENPTFIETIARRGYRFLAPVTTAAGETASDPALPAPQTSPVLPNRSRIWWIVALTFAAVALCFVLVGLKVGLFLGQRRPSVQTRISQLTANPVENRVHASAISRDGRYLAFSDETGFFLRQVDNGDTHPISLPAGTMAESASWFPDGTHLILGLRGEPQSGLWVISTLGGAPRKILDGASWPSVSPDGKQIAYTIGSGVTNELWIMDADGEHPRKLIGQEGEYIGSIAWSPDGTKVAFVRGSLSHEYGITGGIKLLDVRDQTVSTFLQVSTLGWFSSIEGPLAWTRDGSLIYSLSEKPPRQRDSNLWMSHLDSNLHPTETPVRLTSDAGVVTNISASEDGKRLAYVKALPQPDVYVAKVEGQSMNEPVRLTLDDRIDIPFDWTPDSKSVIFISDRSGTFSIYRQSLDQTLPELLLHGEHALLTPRLSPDGTQLIYLVDPTWTAEAPGISLMRMPLAGGAPQQIAAGPGLANQQCARAPGTLCLYGFLTNRKLTFISFDPLRGNGKPVYQIEDDVPQLYNWSLSPDGNMLALVRSKTGNDEPKVHLVSLKGDGDRLLTVQGWPGVSALDWAADSKSLWASSEANGENVLLNVDLEGHARVVWRPKKKVVFWAIPSRDGRYLALHVGTTSANAWMLERQ